MKTWCSLAATVGRRALSLAVVAGCAGDPASLIPADPEAVDPPGVRHASGASPSSAVHGAPAATKPEGEPAGAPEAFVDDREPVAGEVVHGTFGEGIAVDLIPKPVVVEPPLRPFTKVPLISPSVGGSQVFVHHPQVTSFQRDEIAAFLSVHPRFGPLRHQREALRAELEQLGQRQITATLGRLARGLPVFRVRFGRVSGFEVFAEGAIPG